MKEIITSGNKIYGIFELCTTFATHMLLKESQCFYWDQHLAKVVHMLDNAIHWINRYPIDIFGTQVCYLLQKDLSRG